MTLAHTLRQEEAPNMTQHETAHRTERDSMGEVEVPRDALFEAAEKVVEGRLDSAFVLDVFQTGSGTSTNMNANEVISNRAIQIMGGEVGSKEPVHPNDHVNKGQSSNEVIPTARPLAALISSKEDLVPALKKLREALEDKAREFDDVVK